MSRLVRTLVFAVLPFASVPALALVEDPAGERDPRWIEPAARQLVTERVEPGEPGGPGRSAALLRARYGGQWEFTFDRRTGLATLVRGSGIAVVPGRGNDLGGESLAGVPVPDGDLTLDSLEPLVRSFLEANREMLLPAFGAVTLDRGASSIRADGRLASLYFAWSVNGIPVEGAHVFVRLNSGNITQFGAPGVGGGVPDTTIALDGEEAARRLLAWSGDGETARLRDDAELLLQMESAGTTGLDYRPVWVVRYTVPGRIETWEGRLDARTGEVVSFVDVNRYGRVSGGVYERTVVDPEIRTVFSDSDVQLESGVANSDLGGFFTYQGGTASSGLDGKYFNTSCQDGCSNPGQASVNFDVGAGLVDFGLDGVDQVGNGLSTRAERNAYWHANRVRRVAKHWLPAETWLDSNIRINVNINNTCNAVWNGAANFYRSGGGCNNTGEVSDVVHHEWGHGVDGNTQSGDGATGEGTGDTVSFHMSHDPQIGPYFRTTGAPVRNVDKDVTSKGLLTRSNVNTKCGSGSGPLGAEVHCEGEIYGQTGWDLAQALVAKHGEHTGWRTSERIFFTALPDSGSYLPEQANPIYDAYLNADDDDGNLANGTPNGQEIFDAFDLHGIAGSNVGSSAPCTRPQEVSVTALSGCDSIDLSWGAVTGVDHYEILRAEVRLNGPFFHMGTVPSTQTTFTDDQVAPGVEYWYSVMAVAPDGCESTIESPVRASLDDQPILSAVVAVPDDTPRGNRSGFADPGEEVDVALTLRNYGTLDATAISGTLLSPTPGVTILEGFDTWPALASGASGDNQGTLRFETDEAVVACGDTLQFRLVPDESSGCSDDDSYFSVRLGTLQVEVDEDLEAGENGWFWDSANSTASAGHWVYGDPDGTSYQPEDDVTEGPGVNCWFTATNGGGDGVDDVDDGVTILISQAFDLTGLDGARLSFYRWFNNRDTGEDSGDFWKADISDDDGATWVNLETLGSGESAASWTRVEFEVESYVSLTSQVRLRFQAADGTATGNLIEAAVDEVRVERPVCDDTPACYVEPDFSGLDSATQGASCAETDLAWSPASSNCANATISYSVYRSTVPGFTPGDANRVAAGLAGTSFQDTLLEPGMTYHYIVRAYDSRSGEDSNLVERTVVAPSSPDIRAPIFTGLAAALTGGSCGETVLSWQAGQETCNVPVSYEVYRSTDPGFVPSVSNRIGSSLSLSFTDAALVPGQSYTYLVRARDGAGNEDANDARITVNAAILDLLLLEEDFESGDGGWSVTTPNDATTGNWEHGDPVETSYQPDDDHTPDPGANAWVTQLATDSSNGDVDGGTTTMLSALYDLSGAVNPVVRYWQYFTNDRGGSPAEDPFTVEISNDDGSTWTQLDQTSGGTPLAWVERELPLPGGMTPTASMRLRFTAQDLGEGSLVEALVDDFALLDRDQGCSGCSTPVGTVGTILVDRSGNDVVLDWSSDPAAGTRFVVYKLTGPDFSDAVRIGTTDGRTFVHEGAAIAGEGFSYRVTAVDGCGNESPLQ